MNRPVDGSSVVDTSIAETEHPVLPWVVGVITATALFVGLYFDILFRDHNFVYRDAGHFYYPYFHLIQQEWEAGRVPLWNPHENGGEPLAGNPTSSVFYPLKLIFFALPFAAAFKWYHLLHLWIAWGACTIACRGLGVSRWGSVLAAHGYAFGGFVLFQTCNVVFLCGAAWLPLGLLAVDRLVQQPAGRWVLLLAVVLALQVLGGDPQIAHVTGVIGVVYALVYRLGTRAGSLAVAGLAGMGFGLVQGSRVWSQFEPELRRPNGLAIFASKQPVYVAAMVALSLIGACLLVAVLLRRSARQALWQSLKPIALAGALSFGLCAIQVLPTMDLVRVSDRSAPEAPRESVAFSFFPLRAIEFLLPTPFGRQFPFNTRWFPFSKLETGLWVPSSYFGLAPLLLGLAGIRFWSSPASQRFLSVVMLVFFWIAIGKYGGPIWLSEAGKPIDPVRSPRGTKLYGTSDGLYRVCEETIPGFRSFRYPEKMLVICTLAAAMLAGFTLDGLLFRRHWLSHILALLAAFAAVVFLAVCFGSGTFLALVNRFAIEDSGFGPFQADLAWRQTLSSLAHLGLGGLSLAVIFWLWTAPRRNYLAALLLVVVATDLMLANRWLTPTEAQSNINVRPKLWAAIEAEEAKEATREPFRVHRTRIFSPVRWRRSADKDRYSAITEWERDTLQPKYGLLSGVHYTTTIGTMSIYDVEFFFGPWPLKNVPEALREQGLPDHFVYFPRRGFDMWNTKYFILPKGAKFDHEDRGIFSFLASSHGSPSKELISSPLDQDDYQVLKNGDVFPRAWIVHQADLRSPIRGLRRADRIVPMEQLLYQSLTCGVPAWEGEPYGDYPLRARVMIEYEGLWDLAPYSTGGLSTPDETVEFLSYESDRVRLKVRLSAGGFLVLADTYHNGWQATLDDQELVPILRANRAMRAVPVPAGDHIVELRYRSRSFEIGAAISAIAWLTAMGWFAVSRK